MKNIILTLAATVLTSSIVFACPGGNLLQIITDRDQADPLVVADYSITTGERLALREGFIIVSIVSERTGENLCTMTDCSKLKDLDNENIRVSYSSEDEKSTSYVINNVSTGANAPVAKGLPVPAANFGPLQLFGCSKK